MSDLERGVVAAVCAVLAAACGDDTTSTTTGGGGGGGTATSTSAVTTGGQGGDTSTTTGTTGGDGGAPGTGGAAGTGGAPGTGGGGGDGGGDAIQPTPEVIGLETVAKGLVSPLVVHRMPDGSGRLAVADQPGLIRVVEADGNLRAEPLLDLSSRIVPLDPAYDERGLLGFAFHPDYVANGRVFVYYTAPLRAGAPAGYDHTNVVSEIVLSGEGSSLDLASERILLAVDHPQPNHNAGTIAFGPDGFLYISIGDGGGANDVGPGHVEDWYADNAGGNGQDLRNNLLGSILRIDVDAEPELGQQYGIPLGNPFADGTEGLPEIWAFGFRNPFRFSFDRSGDRRLFASDAGQELWEEVSIVEPGGNHGWNVKEGMHCFDAENPKVEPRVCPAFDDRGAPFIDPIVEYPNAKQGGLGFVVVGGHVYRGDAIPGLDGRYVFGDATRDLVNLDGSLLVAEPPLTSGGTWKMTELEIVDRPLGRLGEMVKSFGQDDDGELFVLTSEALGPTGETGKIYRIVPAAAGRL